MTENEAIKRVEEFGLYHAIGDLPNSALTVKAFEMAIEALKEIQQYRAIGTVEECREAREKQRAKKPFKALEHQKKSGYKHKCPKCGCAVGYVEKTPFRKRVLIEHAAPYCCVCGQKLNWSE